MEEWGILNPSNDVHLFLLHKIFLPRLNRHLTDLRNAWNLHPLSTENNHSPVQLMIQHMLPPEMELELSNVRQLLIANRNL